jgi:hypothetical protein
MRLRRGHVNSWVLLLLGAIVAVVALATIVTFYRGDSTSTAALPPQPPSDFAWYLARDAEGVSFFFAIPGRFYATGPGFSDERHFRANHSEFLSVTMARNAPADVREAWLNENIEPDRKTGTTEAGAMYSVRVFKQGLPRTLPWGSNDPDTPRAVAFWSFGDAAAAVELESSASADELEATVIAIAESIFFVDGKNRADAVAKKLGNVTVLNGS